MSDSGDFTDGHTPDADELETSQEAHADEFDPVRVFPEAEAFDLRPGADDCYKCSTCDVNCPVAEVDEEFPGPKFQGPEQWRLKRRADHDVDPSITKCSNCMRCDHACPSAVPLSQMHNTARGAYVDQQLSRWSREYWRNRLLSNYGTMARVGSAFPRTTNFLLGLSVTKWVNERVLGITSEREFPAFATESFRDWWEKRGGSATSKRRAEEAREQRGGSATAKERAERGTEVASTERSAKPGAERGAEGTSEVQGGEATRPGGAKRVAYFHGDYANYNTPEVGKALVRVFEHFGYEVVVPPQRCSGTPMFANGMLDDARRAATFNVETLRELVEEGYDVVCSCTSCSMALRQEYPELFAIEGTELVATNTWDAVEYLRVHEDLDGALDGGRGGEGSEEMDDRGPSSAFAYHVPCHARNQGLDGQTVEVVGAIDGVEAHDVGDSCSGISGTYGWKSAHYETSMAIGEEMFEHMERVDADVGLTECPTCAMQMSHGTGYDVKHTLEVLEAALVGAQSQD